MMARPIIQIKHTLTYIKIISNEIVQEMRRKYYANKVALIVLQEDHTVPDVDFFDE